jgi:FkbM family methyltransferase
MQLRDYILRIYRRLFARKVFRRLNLLLYHCSLRGLGVLNYESDASSGETRFLESWLSGRERRVVFDVGANVGNYSKEILRIDPAATVYAFEPHPKTFERLVSEVHSQNFHANNCGVGEEPGTLLLYDYASEDGSQHASLYRGVIEDLRNKRSVEHKVAIIALQDFLDERSIGAIDLLKIDTEGNELNVIKGLGKYLSEGRVKAIHFEVNEMNVISRTYFKDFWQLLPNYSFYRMLPHGLLPIAEYSPVDCEIFAYQNIVAFLR